ncbi:MAG: hypothetical protein JXQ91_05090 [Vannielia sp.]|uniref:hypothetical protein n=1 Tax=Vannielia sp. TaxID=2813045 RepID=UPI003B8CC5CF
MGTFFSDTFCVDPKELATFGALDISVVNDLPLFIDPFLLFHSEKPEYQSLHESIIEYLVFLRDQSADGAMSDGLLRNWFCFPEVKQNWLGFSMVGNGGTGLGMDFARNLRDNLEAVFGNFGEEAVTQGSHLEKVCLISDGVGRDNVSDFVTNLIQDFLCTYTQDFCNKFLSDSQTRKISIRRAVFNYDTQTWQSKMYRLPWYQGDFILLTPRDLLTRDEIWINKSDLLAKFESIPASMPDGQLRAAVENYFSLALERRKKKWKPAKAKEKREAADETVRRFPELIDYYIRLKELNGNEAADISSERVLSAEVYFSKRMREQLQPLLADAGFYSIAGGTYAEAHIRLAYLKHAVEDQGCWRIFYDKSGKPHERERDIQILFRLVWFGTLSDISPEANDGRGPVDFKVSRGKNKTLVEMKLASNTRLEQNLKKQLEIYQSAADAEKGIKAIVFFSGAQLTRVKQILKRLGLSESNDIVLLDARGDNKPSASKA